MSKKNHKVTIKDLKRVNKVIDRIRSKPSEVVFSKLGQKDDLVVYGLADGSYKLDDKSVGGDLVMLGNIKDARAVPIYWKSKTIKTVCHSAKAAETRAMNRLMDDIQFFALQLEQLLFGSIQRKIPIRIFMDSKPLLESIGSIHQVEEKLMQNSITGMKDVLYDGVVESFSWLNGTTDMVADVLMKECGWNKDLEDLVTENTFWLFKNQDNKVSCFEGEIKISNRCNKKVS
jgi:hypothetical protein